LLAVHLLAVPFGVWWSYAIGLCIGIGWNALRWAMRQRKLSAYPFFQCLDLQCEVARENSALREASSREPEAGLRRAPPHMSRLSALIEALDRADAVGYDIAEVAADGFLLVLVAGGQHHKFGGHD